VIVGVLAAAGAAVAGVLGAVVAWRALAHFLVVVPTTAVPVGVVVAVAAAVALVAIAAGVAVAAHARRTPAATLLRTE
jgi:hypothetical protein